MGSLYLGGPTIQEVDGKMMMGLSIYGVAVISGSLYSRFYGMFTLFHSQQPYQTECTPKHVISHVLIAFVIHCRITNL